MWIKSQALSENTGREHEAVSAPMLVFSSLQRLPPRSSHVRAAKNLALALARERLRRETTLLLTKKGSTRFGSQTLTSIMKSKKRQQYEQIQNAGCLPKVPNFSVNMNFKVNHSDEFRL